MSATSAVFRYSAPLGCAMPRLPPGLEPGLLVSIERPRLVVRGAGLDRTSWPRWPSWTFGRGANGRAGRAGRLHGAGRLAVRSQPPAPVARESDLGMLPAARSGVVPGKPGVAGGDLAHPPRGVDGPLRGGEPPPVGSLHRRSGAVPVPLYGGIRRRRPVRFTLPGGPRPRSR